MPVIQRHRPRRIPKRVERVLYEFFDEMAWGTRLIEGGKAFRGNLKDEVITIGRQQIEAEALSKMQALSTKYAMGISIDQVQLKDINSPEPVQETEAPIQEEPITECGLRPSGCNRFSSSKSVVPGRQTTCWPSLMRWIFAIRNVLMITMSRLSRLIPPVM
ncbi:MAG: hypothetical protein WBX25_31570 [Rhodomicrobium sp.]